MKNKTNTIETKILEKFEEKLGWEFEGATHSTEEDEAFKNRVKAFLLSALRQVVDSEARRVEMQTREEMIDTITDKITKTDPGKETPIRFKMGWNAGLAALRIWLDKLKENMSIDDKQLSRELSVYLSSEEKK